jgi:hypothetical protein
MQSFSVQTANILHSFHNPTFWLPSHSHITLASVPFISVTFWPPAMLPNVLSQGNKRSHFLWLCLIIVLIRSGIYVFSLVIF